MNALIPDIETLKKVVKINSSLPYESIEPYIEDALGALSGWDGVLNVGLVSISYEDELENKGYISCPEHKPRKCGPACFGETPNPLD